MLSKKHLLYSLFRLLTACSFRRSLTTNKTYFMEETMIIRPSKRRLPGIIYFLSGAAVITILLLFASPKYTAKMRKEAYTFGYNDGKASGLTLGEASGFDRAMVEHKAITDSIAEQDSIAEVRAEEDLAKRARHQTRQSANYRVIQTETGYVVGEPIPDE